MNDVSSAMSSTSDNETLWKGGGRGRGNLFEAGRLITFLAVRVGAYTRWHLFEVGRLYGYILTYLLLIIRLID